MALMSNLIPAGKVMKLAMGGVIAGLAVRALLRRSRHIDFAGQVVLITGGSRGLGLILARQLAQQRARIALCARDLEEIEAARRDIESSCSHPVEVLGLVCDVTDREAVESTVGKVLQQWGRVDILINNAGIIQVGPVSEMKLEDFEEAMGVHFWGPLYATRAVLPEMLKRRHGRIVNIASIGGRIGVPHLLPYIASKFALAGLSEGLRAELVKDGVYVTLVCPGLMRTGSHVNAQFSGQHKAEFTWFSLSASAPVVSINAQRAAEQILEACRYGRSNLTITWPAQLASLVHAIAPGMTAETLGLVNRFLPGPNGSPAHNVPGWASRPRGFPSWLTAWGDSAARRNNELH